MSELDIPLPGHSTNDGGSAAISGGGGGTNGSGAVVTQVPTAAAQWTTQNQWPTSVAADPTISGVTAASGYDASTLAYYQAYYGQYGYQPGTTMVPQTPLAATTAYPIAVPPTQPVLAPNLVPQMMAPVVGAAGYSSQTTTASYVGSTSSDVSTYDQNESNVIDDEDDDPTVDKNYGKTMSGGLANDPLPIHGNCKTMNLNPLLLTNIQQSTYFKVTLYKLKTINELIDEIWYNVKHMEPWERGSRKIGGQTGMCGSVRGVGSGGIVSTPFCILYKLFTIKPSRKMINNLIKNKDSPFIRAIGLLFVRYTQKPDDLWSWFVKYLSDDEEFQPSVSPNDPTMTIGSMCRHLLTKPDWYSTLFPRIPVPVQKDIKRRLDNYDDGIDEDNYQADDDVNYNDYEDSVPYDEKDAKSDKDAKTDAKEEINEEEDDDDDTNLAAYDLFAKDDEVDAKKTPTKEDESRSRRDRHRSRSRSRDYHKSDHRRGHRDRDGHRSDSSERRKRRSRSADRRSSHHHSSRDGHRHHHHHHGHRR